MPMELLVVLAVVGLAIVVGWIALHRSTEHAVRGQAHRPGPLAAFGAILDESIAMYRLRELLGRPTTTRADRAVARLQREEARADQATAFSEDYAARLAAAAGR